MSTGYALGHRRGHGPGTKAAVVRAAMWGHLAVKQVGDTASVSIEVTSGVTDFTGRGIPWPFTISYTFEGSAGQSTHSESRTLPNGTHTVTREWGLSGMTAGNLDVVAEVRAAQSGPNGRPLTTWVVIGTGRHLNAISIPAPEPVHPIHRPVIEGAGAPRISPNLSIAAGGANDVTDVSWGYHYRSGPPGPEGVLFLQLQVLYRGREDNRPVRHISPGEKGDLRHRFVSGYWLPGSYSVVVRLRVTPTDRNEWTVVAEREVSFTVPTFPGYGEGFEEIDIRLCRAVFLDGMSHRDYARAWTSWYHGYQQRVTTQWIRSWYNYCREGLRGAGRPLELPTG